MLIMIHLGQLTVETLCMIFLGVGSIVSNIVSNKLPVNDALSYLSIIYCCFLVIKYVSWCLELIDTLIE